jgi:UDP-N-acetylglucosamine 2-epimerase (non-hydrolysing)
LISKLSGVEDRRPVACVIGTRPDAIKMAPVVLELQKSSALRPILISTGQHREMLAQVTKTFSIEPDFDLGIMKARQSLADITTASLARLDALFEREKVEFVLAQGDTTTTFCAALAAFYRKIPFGHVEAGLRTDSIWEPFPEEFNRRAASLTATLHFAPTERAAARLVSEGHGQDSIFVTGNTGLDAVRLTLEQLPQSEASPGRQVILLTTHRRENWGAPQRSICRACRMLLDKIPEAELIAPMHLNPTVRETLIAELGNHPRAHLIEPPAYKDFVRLMRSAKIILTDSGGIQEEAPLLGKPVLVLRNTTERPEGVEAGNAKLVGTNDSEVYSSALELLTDPEKYAQMSEVRSPYGDGYASPRIVAAVEKFLAR